MDQTSTIQVSGWEIRRRRVVRRLTQTELAERAGVDQGWLSKIERGVVPHPSIKFLRALEGVLGRLDQPDAGPAASTAIAATPPADRS